MSALIGTIPNIGPFPDATLVIERVEVPVFVTTMLSVLFSPTGIPPNEIEGVEAENIGVTPVPVAVTLCGLPVAS